MGRKCWVCCITWPLESKNCVSERKTTQNCFTCKRHTWWFSLGPPAGKHNQRNKLEHCNAQEGPLSFCYKCLYIFFRRSCRKNMVQFCHGQFIATQSRNLSYTWWKRVTRTQRVMSKRRWSEEWAKKTMENVFAMRNPKVHRMFQGQTQWRACRSLTRCMFTFICSA